MKALVIPDIHLKPEIIRKATRKMIVNKYDIAVFLGDFCDDWEQGHNVGLYDKTFDALDEFIHLYPDTLICYGNHDISYVWKEWETGYSPIARETVVARLHELYQKYGVERWKYIHKLDNVLFSHAGLTKGFVLEYFAYDTDNSLEHIVEAVNRMGQGELWDDASPIWARPSDGYDFYGKGCLQIVGHTPVSVPEFYKDADLLVCDTFSTYSNGKPIGNQRFVVVDTETKEWAEV